MSTEAPGPPWDLGDGARLRQPTLDDAHELFALIDANRERLEPWMPWAPQTLGPADLRSYLESAGNPPGAHEAYAMEIDGSIVGAASVNGSAADNPGEIGYWIDREHEGQGLVTRAVRVLIDYAFGPLGLGQVTITADVRNARSRAVAERLGFMEYRRETGKRGEDDVIYRLLASEWPLGGDVR